MTTQTTTIRRSTTGAWARIGATAFTLVALAGAMIWLVRPGDEAASMPVAGGTTQGTMTESARAMSAPRMVYLVESVEWQRALTALGLGADELVLVVTTDEDAAQVRMGQERPGVSVIDLRGRSVAPCAGEGTAASDTVRDTCS